MSSRRAEQGDVVLITYEGRSCLAQVVERDKQGLSLIRVYAGLVDNLDDLQIDKRQEQLIAAWLIDAALHGGLAKVVGKTSVRPTGWIGSISKPALLVDRVARKWRPGDPDFDWQRDLLG